jgi:hypothetical protein
MRGLDPRIHHANSLFEAMDCRVKPGNDDERILIIPPP